MRDHLPSQKSILTVSLLMAVACSGSASPLIEEPDIGPATASISLTATDLDLDWVGASISVNATSLDGMGSALTEKPVAWASTNPGIAEIAQKGNAVTVTAGEVGTTTVRAESDGVFAEVTVNVTQVPKMVEKFSGDDQRSIVGTQLSDELVVLVTDGGGSPVGGAQVEFSLKSGGSLSEASVSTDENGRAATTWTLGHTVGSQELSVAVNSINARGFFTATATSGPAAKIALVSGNKQSGTENEELPESLVVAVTDRFGNPVSGHGIGWIATVGGSELDLRNVQTDQNGQARVNWRLGHTGPQSALAVDAKLEGSPITFSAISEKNES